MFLPLKDHNPTTLRPTVTIGLIALNCFVFLIELAHGPSLPYFIAHWGAVPYAFTHFGDVVAVGGNLPVSSGPSPFWITGITSMFLHGGWAHLLFNMLFLWIFGNNVEDFLGHVRYLAFYIVTGLLGLFTHVLLHPTSTIPVVGASGAISGVLGAYMVLYPRARVTTLVFLLFFVTFIEVPAIVLLGFWIILQLFSGLGSLGHGGSGTAHWAHIGGFAAGYLILRFWLAKELVVARRRVAPQAPGGDESGGPFGGGFASTRARRSSSTAPGFFSSEDDYPPPPPKVGRRFGGDPIGNFLEEVERQSEDES
jgi:membrane associated rhomboid family serine protease